MHTVPCDYSDGTFFFFCAPASSVIALKPIVGNEACTDRQGQFEPK